MPAVDVMRLREAYEKVRDELLAERTPVGHWVGELSSSALSTATAISALVLVRRGAGAQLERRANGQNLSAQEVTASSARKNPELERSSLAGSDQIDPLIGRGVAYLLAHQNIDGGFGDTDLSHSNIATTMLVVAALHLAGVNKEHAEFLQRANDYIDSKGRMQGLRERYGVDKTFVVPIMTNLALAGLVDWHEVDPLPFELACVPQSWYRFVGMPVVSYAIPALVAIGQARYFHAPPRNPLTRLIRWMSINRSLTVLRRMQPQSGGYLEATPLTSFVVMSLANAKAVNSQWSVVNSERSEVGSQSSTTGARLADDVIRAGVKFLVDSARPDGSWPIDTNLAAWNTTLAINALMGAGEDVQALLGPQCLGWLLSCQHMTRHAFTGANPGGFGWSDLSGAVPDADDTPGALLAIDSFQKNAQRRNNSDVDEAAQHAAAWLLRLQNRDGGWPTFCRGWGKLPFDRSGADLTAHVLRAIPKRLAMPAAAARTDRSKKPLGNMSLPDLLMLDIERAHTRGLAFLRRMQNLDGSWSPLWFGNQDHPSEENPVYGTARVLMAYRDLGLMDSPEAQRGVDWLVANQNEDGGWGSGAWRMRNAKCEVQSEALGSDSLRSPVPSAQYSVPSTQNHSPNGNPNPKYAILNPKSKIQNLKSSIEETALAVEALLAALPPRSQPLAPSPTSEALSRGLHWLMGRVENNQHRQPAPIGFYFAKLWYYERLYPLIFTVAALGRARRQFACPDAASEITIEAASSDAH